ncbi:MAG TPA: DUF2809 domain-containing protein [Ignavibacteria bacterium]|nr:DUF2809 domain-containing protein [Ignavibacteria bacterium]
MTVKRNRLIYFFLIVIVILAGLASRKFHDQLPPFIAEYSGDTLWALMVFFLAGFIFSTCSTIRIAIISLTFSFAVEFSQLYQANWINDIRHTRIGGLILGFGFLWSDLICYTAGILIGITLEKLFLIKKFKTSLQD